MRRFTHWFLIGLIALACLPGAPCARSAMPIDDPMSQKIETIRASLSAEERVGQLMLVTFRGTDIGPGTAIHTLITEYNLGGVVLLAENDNIAGPDDTPGQVKVLAEDLQQLAYEAILETDGQASGRSFVPLFIATTHAGNGQPGTQIALGTTPLPSYMTLGATWNPDYARQVGEIAGSELSAMGINMLLGPALDVVQQPQSEHTLDLGVQSFGGEPFWVGKMAQAYITGVHESSQGRIAVIAQHFPGLGLADTQPDQEIPVVPRSAEELRRFDLLPFYAVTGDAANTPARAEGIQCANVRYQGENIRSITRPICVDEQAAGQLLNLDYFRDWHERGVLISSSLGSQAIRRYYNIDPFPHRQVAREALLAGNDILYLNDFGPRPSDDQIENVIDVIKFFAERYESDPVFRTQVDRSLTRVLRLKLTLYDGDLSPENVQTPVSDITAVGQAGAELYSIAQRSITLIAPGRESLPPTPARNDTILIFTDTRSAQQCSGCPIYDQVPVDGLEAAIERMYGPYAGAQIRPEQITSFSFVQFAAYFGDASTSSLDDDALKTRQLVGDALRSADWIVFVSLGISPTRTESGIVQDFLETETALAEQAHVVVIALGAPTYLSSTEIGKLAAYYGLYSHTQPAIDAAARALFQETSFTGVLPISLPAVGYDIFEATAPEPGQTIQLVIETLGDRSVRSPTDPTEPLTMFVDEKLTLRTEPIEDRNGHPVPDNTPVEFMLTFITDNLQTRQYGATLDGVAYTSFTPNRAGHVQITAACADATQSYTFQIIITDASTDAQANQPAAENGSPGPGETPSPEAALTSPDDTGDDFASILGEPLSQAENESGAGGDTSGAQNESDSRWLHVTDLFLSLFGLALMSILAFSLGLSATLTTGGGIRVVLGSVVAGLIGYIYYGVSAPGANQLHTLLDSLAPIVTTLASGLVGLLAAWWSLPHHR